MRKTIVLIIFIFLINIFAFAQIGIDARIFITPATEDLDMANFDILMGTGGIGNDNPIITFAIGATGAMTSVGQILTIDGTKTIPALAPSSNSDMGIFFSGSSIKVSIDDSEKWEISSDGIFSATTGGGRLKRNNGSVSSAALSFAGDLDLGLFRVTTDSMGETVGGVEARRITESGDDIVHLFPTLVDSITIDDGGTGYANSGALVITDEGTGTGMTGTFTATAGVIDSVSITDRGNGYTYAPTIDGDVGGNGDAVLTPVMRTNDLVLGGLVTTKGLTVSRLSEALIDDGSIIWVTGVSGWGFVMAGDNEEWVHFNFKADGTVELKTNSTNVDDADTDTNLCIFDSGSGITIRNRLGATKTISFEIHYF